MALELTFQTNYELKVRLVYFGKPALSIVPYPVELHRSWLLRHFSRFPWTNKVHSHILMDQQSPSFTLSILSIDLERSPRRSPEAIASILSTTGAIVSSQSHFSHTHRSRVESPLRSSISISLIPISDIPHSIRENESHHIKRSTAADILCPGCIQLHLTWLAHVLVSALSTFCSNVLDNLTRRLLKAIVASESLQR
jgi:hypothetical protein